jgi:hypothetical protein
MSDVYDDLDYCQADLKIYTDQINFTGDEPFVWILDLAVYSSHACTFNSGIQLKTESSSWTAISDDANFVATSVLVPSHWQAQLRNDIGEITVIDGPAWFSNIYRSTKVPQNIGHFTEYKVSRNNDWYTQILSMCSEDELSFIGPNRVDRWVPQTQSCDDFMTSFCSTQENQTSKICSCLTAEKTLYSKYNVALPVICMDQNCATEDLPCCATDGYRSGDMLRQGCNMTMCSKIVKGQGTQLVDAGDTEIYCAGKFWNILPDDDTPGTDVPIPPSTQQQNTSTAWYVWLMAVLAFIIAVGLGIYITVTTKI